MASCQTFVGELEFRDAKTQNWRRNNGTAQASTIMASSGDGDPGNPPWMAVDGNYSFVEYQAGWDSGDIPLPDPPPAPAASNISYHWDLNALGSSAVWVGSVSGGLRMRLKGPEPMWQASLPADSGQALPPPAAWSNNGQGNITLDVSGTVCASTGYLPAGPIDAYFSLLPTPVKPVDWNLHWKLRYAQLSGAANYSYIAEKVGF